MTIGTVMIAVGVGCIVISVMLWIVFCFFTRRKCKRQIMLLVDEYSCRNGDQL